MTRAEAFERTRDAVGELLAGVRRLLAALADLIPAASFLAGWALLTWGVARATTADAWIWSGGAFLLFVVLGWRLLWSVLRNGLWDLMTEEEVTSDD